MLPLWAADDTDAVLKRFIEAQTRNDRRAEQYTYVQQTERFTYDKNRRLHRERAAVHEIVFIEGLPYRKLITRNGQPLSPREQAQVENEMRQIAVERRQHRRPLTPGGRIWFGSDSADAGSLPELLTLFNNQLLGEADIRDREAWVLESTPHAAPANASDHEKEVLSFRKKFWIDKADGVAIREIYTVIGEDTAVKPASTITYDFQKIDGDTWAPYLIVLESYKWRNNHPQPVTRVEYRMSKFQKFDVQSTITAAASK